MDNGGQQNNTSDGSPLKLSDSCFYFPGWVSNVPQLPFIHLQLQMLMVFCVNQTLYRVLFRHIGMPPFVTHLCTGFILGETGLGHIKEFANVMYPGVSNAVIKCIIMFSYTLFLFVNSAQVDFTIIMRMGKKTMFLGLSSVISAVAVNTAIVAIHNPAPEIARDVQNALGILPLAAFPNLIQLVTDIGLINSELGRLTLACGLFVEIASIGITMIMKNIIPSIYHPETLVKTIINMSATVVILLVVIFILRPFMNFLIRMTPKDRPIKDTYVLLAFVLMLSVSLVTNYFGQFVLLGAVFVGFALPNGPPLGSALVEKLDSLFSGVLFPFIVSSAAMRINLGLIGKNIPLLNYMAILMVVMTVTKVGVSFICGICNKMARRDALALAFLMCTKGFLELGTMTWLHDIGGISAECVSVLMIYVIFMAALVPFAVKLLYDPMRKYGGYQIRDVTHLKPNAHLKLVACVLRPDNISSITNLLEFLNPVRNVPIAAYIIHLVKLVGRFQPLFISHAMQKKQNSSHSYSDEVIWHFDRLQQCSNGGLSTQVFTALAHVDAMHEYLCTLALDKVVSLIVLPFHRKFGIEGFIDFDDHEQRQLNTSVLSRSPCSVAILVDRSHVNLRNGGESSSSRSRPMMMVTQVGNEPLLLVAVVFMGGNDDREALAFAKRMSRGMRVKMNVIRLASPGDGEEFMNSLDAKAIDKFLYEAKFEDGNLNQEVTYVQIMVKDGVETVATLRSMVQDYDLIIVGRRFNSHSPQTAGLEESCEIKELGILGDLLASQDLKCRTSVLVVQQQQHWM